MRPRAPVADEFTRQGADTGFLTIAEFAGAGGDQVFMPPIGRLAADQQEADLAGRIFQSSGSTQENPYRFPVGFGIVDRDEQATLADRQSGGPMEGDHARAPAILALAQHVGNLGCKAGLARTARTTEEADGYGALIVACPGKQLIAVVFTTDQGRREAGTPGKQVEDAEPIRPTGQVTPGEAERCSRLPADDGLNDDTVTSPTMTLPLMSRVAARLPLKSFGKGLNIISRDRSIMHVDTLFNNPAGQGTGGIEAHRRTGAGSCRACQACRGKDTAWRPDCG